jgi:UDP-2-acetamido-3-amino-2,3-dideoxy-glucuronate N-acetyltransferase
MTMARSQSPWLAVVGCGQWGINHVTTAASMNALLAVVDSDPDAREFAVARVANHNVVGFASLAELLNANIAGFKAVVVATPPATHASVAEQALEAGLSVLVEKPMCYSVADARRLAAIARSAPHCKVMVGHLLHYGRPHAVALQLIKKGRVGEVKRVKAIRVNFGTVRTVENALWSLCPHDLSVALAICNAQADERDLPKRVRCTGHNIVCGNGGVEDSVDVTIELCSGALVQIESNWMHPGKERRMIVYGDTGFIAINEAVRDQSLPAVQLWSWDATVKGTSVPVDISTRELDVNIAEIAAECAAPLSENWSPLRSELEHFRECCFDSAMQPLTDADEGLRVIQVLAAATESMRSRDGDWVPVDTDDSLPPQPAPPYFAHATAIVDDGATVGPGSKIWHFSHVMSGAVLGERCSLGQNVYVAGKANLGRNVRVQNNVSIYDGVTVGDNAFLGPSCVFTNVRRPRVEFPTAASSYGSTSIGTGVSIGANAVIVCDVRIGDYAMIGAGAVVTKDVKKYALVVGNPGREIGWVGRDGHALRPGPGNTWLSDGGDDVFELVNDELRLR